MAQRRAIACGIVLAWAAIARADEAELGGLGESCRARSDCAHGLKCIANVCLDPHDGLACTTKDDCGLLDCVDGRCANSWAPASTTPPLPPPPPPPSASNPAPSASMTASPRPPPPAATPSPPVVHPVPNPVVPFVGVTIALGFLRGGYSASEGALWGTGADASLLLALRAGLLFGRHELALEVAPGTDFWDLVVERGPAFEANVSYGYLLPLSRLTSWPLRLGVGVLAGGDNTGANVLFELRADVVGVRLQRRHWAFDFHAPSFRYALTNGHVPGVAVEGVTTHYLSFFFGTSVSYVF